MTARVARHDVRQCRLERGSPEPRPLISALLGTLLMAPGWLILRDIVEIVRTGEWHLEQGFDAVFLLFIALGVWLASRALLVRRYYLLVITTEGIQRYSFDGRSSREAILKFIHEARARWQWDITGHLARPEKTDGAEIIPFAPGGGDP
jgi:hypothetical protein